MANGAPVVPGDVSARQEAFVDALVRCGDRKAAALAAGYAPASADDTGHKLMMRPEIRQLYEKRRREYLNRPLPPGIDDVVRELARLAFHDPTAIFGEEGGLLPVTSWPLEIRRSIASIEVVMKNAAAGDGHIDRVLKIRWHDKTKALELLARHLGMLIERKEIGSPGAFQALSDDELARRIHAASSRLAELTAPPQLTEGESAPSQADRLPLEP